MLKQSTNGDGRPADGAAARGEASAARGEGPVVAPADAPAAAPGFARVNPVVITIARDYGAEGHEIGSMLSRRLNIPFYDNEILVRAALRGNATVDDVAAYDERPAAETGAFLPDRVDARTRSDELFDAVARVITDLGNSCSCIIVGRLSEYILRSNPNLVSVLVTAPFEERVEIVRAKRGLTKAKGARLVRQRQREREAFYRRYSAGKCLLHDRKNLVVDRSAYGLEGCCEIIEAAYRAKLETLARQA